MLVWASKHFDLCEVIVYEYVCFDKKKNVYE